MANVHGFRDGNNQPNQGNRNNGRLLNDINRMQDQVPFLNSMRTDKDPSD